MTQAQVREIVTPSRNIRSLKVGEIVYLAPNYGSTMYGGDRWYGNQTDHDYNGGFNGAAEIIKFNPKSVTVKKLSGFGSGELYKINPTALASKNLKKYIKV